MKTTVQISDALLDEIRRITANENTTLRALVEEGLHKVIKERSRSKPFKLRKATFKGNGVHPDLAGISWDRIREISYGKRGS